MRLRLDRRNVLRMPRPSRDRVMVSFYISRTGKAEVEKLAKTRGQTKADTYRELLRVGLQHTTKTEKL